jgi:hypothetical protein
MKRAFRSSWLMGAWLGVVVTVVATSMAIGITLSTAALLLAIGMAPAIVIALLAHGEPAPSVAQILYSVESKDGRS